MSIMLLDKCFQPAHGAVAVEVLDPYDCTLNITDLKTNKNRFYIMQIVRTTFPAGRVDHGLFIRYGRIGEIGKYSTDHGDLDFCVRKFVEQFKSKTKNSWADRDKFKRFPDKYYLCDKKLDTATTSTDNADGDDVDEDNDAKNDADDAEVAEDDSVKASGGTGGGKTGSKAKVKAKTEPEKPVSKLVPEIIDFLGLIGNLDMLKSTMKSIDIDITRLPLGAISDNQLSKAGEVLKKIGDLLISVPVAPNIQDKLMELSSEYYTLVPVVTARRTQRPPVIDSLVIMDTYRQKIDELRNIKIAYAAILDGVGGGSGSGGVGSVPKEHPADRLYSQLNTQISVVDKSNPVYGEIEKYVFQTQGRTHYVGNIEIVGVYEISRESDAKRLDMIGNRYLLWHGTRLSNYISILQKGLILRPELLNTGVQITGKMFGYGIYGANSFSKSYNYCDAGSSKNKECCLFLAEFSLGNIAKKVNADYTLTKDRLKAEGGFHSTWGQGLMTPSETGEIEVDGAYKLKIPNGKLTESKIAGANLNYDEFIVYDESQIRLKYIVRVRSK